jgi:hypothetical protein
MSEFYKMDYELWDNRTFDLTLEEEAAYLRLCHAMYRLKRPVAGTDKFLCSIWRCHENKARPLLRKLIEKGKIERDERGYLTNSKVRQELDARETLRTHRVHAGHTGGTRSAAAKKNANEINKEFQANSTRGEERREEDISIPSPNGDGRQGADPAKLKLVPKPAPETQATSPPEDPRKVYFDLGKEILGKSAGGMLAKLLHAKADNIDLATGALMTVKGRSAGDRDAAKSYVQGMLNRMDKDATEKHDPFTRSLFT